MNGAEASKTKDRKNSKDEQSPIRQKIGAPYPQFPSPQLYQRPTTFSSPVVGAFEKELNETFVRHEHLEDRLRLRNEFNEQTLLTQDPFFSEPSSFPPFPPSPTFLYGTPPPTTDSAAAAGVRRLSETLDFTRITNRLILSGLFWKEKSDKATSRRNNIIDAATFLKRRFGDRFMIWNFAGKYASLHRLLVTLIPSL